MTTDLDIYRSANVLVKQHGEDAPLEAAMRADAMFEAGGLDGSRRTFPKTPLMRLFLSFIERLR